MWCGGGWGRGRTVCDDIFSSILTYTHNKKHAEHEKVIEMTKNGTISRKSRQMTTSQSVKFGTQHMVFGWPCGKAQTPAQCQQNPKPS